MHPPAAFVTLSRDARSADVRPVRTQHGGFRASGVGDPTRRPAQAYCVSHNPNVQRTSAGADRVPRSSRCDARSSRAAECEDGQGRGGMGGSPLRNLWACRVIWMGAEGFNGGRGVARGRG
jgi:hypothetical protein